MACSRGCCPSRGEHYRSLRYFKAALGPLHDKDRQLSKDLGAYKRLTESGLEPQRIDGCHHWERTDAPAHEIEGRLPDGIYDQ